MSPKPFEAWALISLAINIVLVLLFVLLLKRSSLAVLSYATTKPLNLVKQTLAVIPGSGLRPLPPNYQQRLSVLRREADNAAKTRPKHLTILLGNSITDFFPPEMLPPGRSWLNQGIAGDTTAGVLERLQLFDCTQPETIFVLIGTNDLTQGVDDATILANQQKIVDYLKQAHPNSQIVIQSILPRKDEPKLPGSDHKYGRIQKLNQQLLATAKASRVHYLNLYPLFANTQGSILPELTTDGLHLSSQGYLVWRSALQLYSQLELEPTANSR
ncbi:MAG: hypothetical protein JOZ78_12390 [Chroococcidiopsidaceae cyanobacterium CP_BM_ER_R8_30]|nr:hypothetical protein [Chroococcidiopsidaceae cyanobacterium CP_BM_ER_R8_30]